MCTFQNAPPHVDPDTFFFLKTATIPNAPPHVNPGTTGPHGAGGHSLDPGTLFYFSKKPLFRMRHHTWTLVRQGLVTQTVALGEPRGLAGLGVHDHFAPRLAVAGVQHEALLVGTRFSIRLLMQPGKRAGQLASCPARFPGCISSQLSCSPARLH